MGAAMKCHKCGYEIEVQQNRAAKSRWSGMTANERAAEMSRVRRKGIKKPKRSARRANDRTERQTPGCAHDGTKTI